MNLINTTNAALPDEAIGVNYINTQKCKIIGTIKEIKIMEMETNKCGSNVYLNVIGDKEYLIRTSKALDGIINYGECGDSIGYGYGINDKLPKVGDKVEFIVDKENHYLMTKTGKLEYGNGKLDLCKNNFLEIYILEQNISKNNYGNTNIIIYFLIIFIIITSILFIRKLKKLKKGSIKN